jgi:pimeloyl-ACP methyl ester carboxylesterase
MRTALEFGDGGKSLSRRQNGEHCACLLLGQSSLATEDFDNFYTAAQAAAGCTSQTTCCMANDRHVLTWGAPKAPPTTLPGHIQRKYIPTTRGPLELLIAQPPKRQGSYSLFFQHGGFGCASVWIPYLTYFSQRGFNCYAVSLRGHGASWQPSYLELVFRTGRKSMSEDLGVALNYVRKFEEETPANEAQIVLIGHSAGGGLGQYFLSRGLGTVHGLVLISAFPSFGG